MKISYTASNRAHHYPFAKALHKAGMLYAFISGFSRFSARAALPEIGNKLKRYDIIQTFYVACYNFKFPAGITGLLNRLAYWSLDTNSFRWAKKSDIFIFYRTQGIRTMRKLKRKGSKTLCILEEVNSHVDLYYKLMKEEYEKLGLGEYTAILPDHQDRLKAYSEADYILVSSDFVRRSFLEKGFPAEKMILMHYGFSLPANVTYSKTLNEGPLRILYVGQINMRKGLRYAIEAFKALDCPGKEFYIVGNQTAITGLENVEIPEGVIFTGSLKGEDLEKQYKSADVFVLPSIEDGFGLVAGEALSYGTPVIVSSNCGASDIITDGYNGFIVPPFNSDAIKLKLEQLAKDKTLLSKLSQNAFESLKDIKDWDTIVAGLKKDLQEKLNQVQP